MIENAFGVFANTWRIFLNRLNIQPHKATTVVKACAILHNFIIAHNEQRNATNFNEGEMSLEQLDAQGMGSIQSVGIRPGSSAIQIRDNFAHYFTHGGSVSWQDNMI